MDTSQIRDFALTKVESCRRSLDSAFAGVPAPTSDVEALRREKAFWEQVLNELRADGLEAEREQAVLAAMRLARKEQT